VLRIWLHDRFHGMAFGAPEWPPAPARVFQALVAGCARGRRIPDEAARAFRWLEALPPPRIGTPPSRLGSTQSLWVPNNDLDALGGDPSKVSLLRTAKTLVPRLFDGNVPLLFVWTSDTESEHLPVLAQLADHLYQFGRGVDLAWARGELAQDDEVDRILATYGGTIHVPGDRAGVHRSTLCPTVGSFDSLARRFAARRIREVVEKRKRLELFENAPKPLFVPVRYGRKRSIVVYDLLDARDDRRPFAVSLRLVATLVQSVRDGAAARLREAFPDQTADIARILIGRKPDGRDGGPVEDRVRIVPLPSIGHEHADLGVRRLAVELPGGASLSVEDLVWAFDGLAPSQAGTGEVAPYLLVRNRESPMVARYARGARRFWSLTPAALPESSHRRRIDPSHLAAEAKAGAERGHEETRACAAVRAALRHAGVLTELVAVRVQREPFHARGSRVEAFAPGTRFPKERLWHIEVAFRHPVEGPLVIGDGRFLGLGVMAPQQEVEGVHAFAIESGLNSGADATDVTRALRRAVMSRVQHALGPRRTLAAFFSGHSADGAPARSDEGSHLSFAFLPEGRTLLVIAPHVVERRSPYAGERDHLALLDEALRDLGVVRAGRAGLLTLRRYEIDRDCHPIFAPRRRWRTVTPYQVTRHQKNKSAFEALSADLRAECRRRGLPVAKITPRSAHGVAGVGLLGEAELEFARAIPGPILLGKSRHFGGGLFVASSAAD
jgi:CRISPR-associated protein Csb2